MLFSISIAIAQNSNENQTENIISYDLYVCFNETIQFNDEDYLNKILILIPELQNLVVDYNLQFEKGIAISEQKLLFMESEALRISNSSKSVQKLRNILKVKIDNPTLDRLQFIANTLKTLPQIEYASLLSSQPVQPPIDIAPTTTNFEPNQGYLNANPGVNMAHAWGLGLSGSGIKVRDVEYGFNKNHEELSDINTLLAPDMTISSSASTSYTEHGTAVFGILYAHKGTYGISGMAYGAQELILYPEWQVSGYNRINAVTKSIENSVAGDVILYEMQTGGQSGNYVPAEYNSVVWNLTKAATDSGIIIVAAAGNGNENLDDSFYTTYIARGDSGAIIVGAGSPDIGHNKMSFSTYGSRVDVQGWGSNVIATGYGSYATFGGDFNQQYTSFSGTSSATPIVASCAIVLQSYYFGLTGNYMTSIQLRNLLKSTGIAQGSGGNIGPIPNMQAAITQIGVMLSKENFSKSVLFTMYPNPAKNKVNINMIDNPVTDSQIEIFNALGQKVYVSKMESGLNEIMTNNFQQGLYFVTLTNGKKTATKKLIIE